MVTSLLGLRHCYRLYGRWVWPLGMGFRGMPFAGNLTAEGLPENLHPKPQRRWVRKSVSDLKVCYGCGRNSWDATRPPEFGRAIRTITLNPKPYNSKP